MNDFAIVKENVQKVETEAKTSRPRKYLRSSISGSVCVSADGSWGPGMFVYSTVKVELIFIAAKSTG
jgi:hypothetical protein